MKKAGIVADNYKIDKFKKELIKAGFTDFKIFTFTLDTSTIQVDVPDHQLKQVEKICKLVELHFKRSN